MTHYIALLRFTAKGVESITDSTKRANQFKKLARKAGVKIVGQFWTMGAFDGVLIIAADDEARAMRLMVELAAEGNVRAETMRAMTNAEFDAILG